MIGTFQLIPPDGRAPFEAILGGAAPVVTDGYGGWSKVPRPRRRALTEWVGANGPSVQVEFYLDGEGLDVEGQIKRVERMAGLDPSAMDAEPPLVSIVSDPPGCITLDRHEHPGWLWFVDSLNWDPGATYANREGNRIRAKGQIVLSQFVEDERLSSAAKAKAKKNAVKGKGKKGSRSKTYRVRAGDTLASIAARNHVKGGWHALAKLNNIRDPKHLKLHSTIKLP